MSLHGAKVAIVVQERVPVDDAKSADDEIDGFADLDALAAQKPIVFRRGDGQRPRISRLCVVSARASRLSLSAWAPKPISVNHRGWQFFARPCNRDGVINPANSLERCLRGTQDVVMLGSIIALERVDDNVFH